MNKYKFHQRYGLNDSYKNLTLYHSSIKMNNKNIRKPRPKSNKVYQKINKDSQNNPMKNLINNNDGNIINNYNTNLNIIDLNKLKNKRNSKSQSKSNYNFKVNNSFSYNNINNNKNHSNYKNKKRLKTKKISDSYDKGDIKNNEIEAPYKYNSINNKKNNNNDKYDHLSQKQYLITPNINVHQEYNITRFNIKNNKKSFNSTQNKFNNFPNFGINKSINTNFDFNNYESDKIKSQIEEAAKNMIGDMNQIITNITNDENNFKNQLIELEKKYTNRLNELENSKNKIINNLKNKIKQINEHNDFLINELSNIENDNNLKCNELSNVINNLKNNINSKEDEIYRIKQNINKQGILSDKNKEEEKNNLCYLYENKINDILNFSDNNQLKLLNIIKEKDRIIQELINANGNKGSNYNYLINKIQKENEVFKDVSKRSIHLAENNIYNNFINDISHIYQNNDMNNFNINGNNINDNYNNNYTYQVDI